MLFAGFAASTWISVSSFASVQSDSESVVSSHQQIQSVNVHTEQECQYIKSRECDIALFRFVDLHLKTQANYVYRPIQSGFFFYSSIFHLATRWETAIVQNSWRKTPWLSPAHLEIGLVLLLCYQENEQTYGNVSQMNKCNTFAA